MKNNVALKILINLLPALCLVVGVLLLGPWYLLLSFVVSAPMAYKEYDKLEAWKELTILNVIWLSTFMVLWPTVLACQVEIWLGLDESD